MRLLFWALASVIALGTITPTLFVITALRNVLNYIGDKLASILLYIDNNVGIELDQQRLEELGREYMKRKKQ